MRMQTALKQALFAREGEAWTTVSLPHTWNALDGQDGGDDYYRGIGTYRIQLPTPTPGMRQYIEINGANHAATVWCNGRELGTHRGGFSTFRYELTAAMKKTENILTVAVTNAVSDIYPQRADFTFFGGLYRDVNFIQVPDAHFDLMQDGSRGVFVTARNTGRTRLDLFPVSASDCTVEVEILNGEGLCVQTVSGPAREHTVLSCDVAQPHLWHGVEDPYLYTAKARLVKDGETLDEVTVAFGYRSFRTDACTGFHLNGKSFPLHGVCRHQDRKDKGWALSRQDHEEDAALIGEVGANTIRLAHYQHDQYFYDLCDRYGFVVWAEIPFISIFRPGQEAYDNTMSQMRELIAQCYNHPSICFWGIANEITIGGFSEELYRNLCDLNALCKTMDPSRLTTIAHIGGVPIHSDHIYITDVQSYNYYLGWYSGTIADNGPRLDRFHEANPDLCCGVAEYGADHLPVWHSASPVNHDYTEEYACMYHRELLKIFAQRPYLWATHLWNMFDFAVDARDEGGVKGLNTKGLVTHDRKLKKDTFFLYKAWWTKAPMVHIAGRRFRDRAPGERDVTVYTNCPGVTLLLNGREYATSAVEDCAAVFADLPLLPGENTLTARSGGAEDTITLVGAAEHNTDYDLPDIAAAQKAGNWFASVSDEEESEEIVISDGMFSIRDTLGDLLSNETCYRIIQGWIMASSIPEANKMTTVARLTNWRAMWKERQFCDMPVFQKATALELARLNRMLSGVVK